MFVAGTVDAFDCLPELSTDAALLDLTAASSEGPHLERQSPKVRGDPGEAKIGEHLRLIRRKVLWFEAVGQVDEVPVHRLCYAGHLGHRVVYSHSLLGPAEKSGKGLRAKRVVYLGVVDAGPGDEGEKAVRLPQIFEGRAELLLKRMTVPAPPVDLDEPRRDLLLEDVPDEGLVVLVCHYQPRLGRCWHGEYCAKVPSSGE